MKKITKLTIFFTVLFIALGVGAYLQLKSLKGYTKVEDLCNDSYYPFGLNKGYEPGSIISIRTHWWYKDRIKVEKLEVGRKRLEDELVDKSFLRLTAKTPINQCTYDQTTDFKAAIDQKIVENSEVNQSLRSELTHLAKVKIKANKGSRYGLTDGGSGALQDILRHLPAYELDKLLRVIDRGRELVFVSEVIEYDDATADFYWKDSLSGESQLAINDLFDIEGVYNWNSRGNLVINFAKGSIVGFSGSKLLKQDVQLINSVLSERAEKGNLIILYPDADGDGYGSDITAEAKLFGDKEPDSLKTSTGTIIYVRNSLDEDDRNPKINPNSIIWYRDADGDGYGDAGSTKLSTTRPEGFVDNDLDCYDHNANAFPGQPNSFSNHRGDGSFDYDCDNSSTIQLATQGGCVNGCRTLRNGWEHSPPSCGQSAPYVIGCNNGSWPKYKCRVYTELRTQFCR